MLNFLQNDSGFKVRSEEMADRRNSEQNWSALLPLLSSDERDELSSRGVLVLRSDTRSCVLQSSRQGGP